MKVLLIVLACVFCASFSFSQKKTETVRIVDKVKINIYHNPHDLAKLGKHSLKKLYIRRVIAFMELAPFLSHQVSGGSSTSDLEVPMNKTRLKKLKKYEKKRHKYYTSLKATLNKTINYADKGDIINRIVLVDNAIGDLFNYIKEREQLQQDRIDRLKRGRK